MSFQIRPMRSGDRNYILATWSKGIIRESPYNSYSKEGWRSHHDRMERLLVRDGGVLVAVNPDFEDHIIGYSVFSENPPAIHWIYVKKDFRGLGIAKELLKSSLGGESFSYTHRNRVATSYARSHEGVKYDPFIFLDADGRGA